MTHSEWIRSKFRALSTDLGFRYTPHREIAHRLNRVRQKIETKGIEALLVVQKVDRYYLSATTQDGILFLPSQGEPLLMVKRELERAKIESPLNHIIALGSVREMSSLITAHYGRLPKVLGLELDVLPVRDYLFFQELFPGTKFLDGSPVLREVRSIKSSFEIELIRVAGEIGRKVYEVAGMNLKEGMTEIELGGILGAAAMREGNEGLLRVRSLNYEAYTWHVLSGFSGGMVSQSDSPMGGLGMSPAFPVGASRKVMKAREPILIDFGSCYHGYQADETRMFSIGPMEQKFLDAFHACREIHDAVLQEIRPGADGEAIFMSSLRLAQKLGYRDNFLGPPGLQTRFLAHGIGLELNEFPFIAQGQSWPLEKGMILALEPKIVFPGEGSAGIENTLVVTESGYEILTLAPEEVVQV